MASLPSACSGFDGHIEISRAPPSSSKLRDSVPKPDSASEVISTIENAPITIEATVSVERNRLARSTRKAICR
jgi:hypothetical protein